MSEWHRSWHTDTDPTMQQLINCRNPRRLEDKKAQLIDEMKPYFAIRDELVVDQGIVFKRSRVVIPSSLHWEVIDCIHYAQMGVVACLRRARLSVYWPNMTNHIKEVIKQCEPCNHLRSQSQKSEPLIQHSRPERPWAKIGIDLCWITIFKWSQLTTGALHWAWRVAHNNRNSSDPVS